MAIVAIERETPLLARPAASLTADFDAVICGRRIGIWLWLGLRCLGKPGFGFLERGPGASQGGLGTGETGYARAYVLHGSVLSRIGDHS